MARLRDFQIHSFSGTKSVNGAFFHTYEPVRLWLKARKLAAPFMKLLVTLSDERTGRQWHGHVTNGLGICEITEAVDVSTMVKHAEDHRWLLGVVLHALGCVAKATGWRSPELERFVADLRERPSPLVHVFERLARVDKRTGATCVPWFSTGPRETALGVRIGERDVTVLSGHVWLEGPGGLRATELLRGKRRVPGMGAGGGDQGGVSQAAQARQARQARQADQARQTDQALQAVGALVPRAA